MTNKLLLQKTQRAKNIAQNSSESNKCLIKKNLVWELDLVSYDLLAFAEECVNQTQATTTSCCWFILRSSSTIPIIIVSKPTGGKHLVLVIESLIIILVWPIFGNDFGKNCYMTICACL